MQHDSEIKAFMLIGGKKKRKKKTRLDGNPCQSDLENVDICYKKLVIKIRNDEECA